MCTRLRTFEFKCTSFPRNGAVFSSVSCCKSQHATALMDLAEYSLNGLKTEKAEENGLLVLILIQKKSIHWHLLPIKSLSDVCFPPQPRKKLLIKSRIDRAPTAFQNSTGYRTDNIQRNSHQTTE